MGDCLPLDEACRWHAGGGWRMAVPRLAPWAGMRRRVATGGAAAPRLWVICFWLLGGEALFHTRFTVSTGLIDD